MTQLRDDLRVPLRSLRRDPGFVVTAMLILGLGIGMAVAMFTVFQGVLLRPLPVSEQDRIILPRTVDHSGVDIGMSQPEFEQVLRQSRTIRSVAGVWHGGALPSVLEDGERSMVLDQAHVTGNFFDVLGARPALGRLLQDRKSTRL